MARPDGHKQSFDSVQASLNYLIDSGEKPVTYSTDPGTRLKQGTGRYEERTVTIQDGRPILDRLYLIIHRGSFV